MIYVDFDNTLIVNPYDVDLGNSLEKFRSTWQSLQTEPYCMDLIHFLQDRPQGWSILTNRGGDTMQKMKDHLWELKLAPEHIYPCAGAKMFVIQHMRNTKQTYFLFDNNAKYEPNCLVTPELRLPMINKLMGEWVGAL